MRGRVFDVSHGTTKDGPGIRTTVFLKGCPLHCLWCHNPESQRREAEMLFFPDKCTACLRCVSLCPNGVQTFAEGRHIFRRPSCSLCGKCLSAGCGALKIAGKMRDVEEVLDEVLKDKPFYDRTGGGMTLSGGEPLFQKDFCLALLKAGKEAGLHTAVETAGAVKKEALAEILPYTDLFLYDYKETDPERHRLYTGWDNRTILENLCFLDGEGKPLILRCPIVPGYNDRPDHFAGIARTANRLKSLIRVEIEPYHALGEGKYAALGRERDDFRLPTGEYDPARWCREIGSQTDAEVTLA